MREYRIFISHAWRYSQEYERLVRLLASYPWFKYRNYSVPSYRPLKVSSEQELVQALYRQIRPVHIVIVLSGLNVNYRYWIQKEIEIALTLGKLIIGIKPWGRKRVPELIKIVANEIVGWNTKSIVNAIRRNAL